jgi:hypothetical protein
VDVRNFASTKLLLLRLTWLRDELRVEANPAAERVQQILDIFERTMTDGGKDDGASDA